MLPGRHPGDGGGLIPVSSPGTPRTAGGPADSVAAVAELEALLDELERRLDSDAWDDAIGTSRVVPAQPAGGASDALARAAALEARLRAELDATAAALRDLRTRRAAAGRYGGYAPELGS